MPSQRETPDAAKSPCPTCGSTEWTLRVGLGIPRRDGKPTIDVCNVCSPARPRERHHALRWRWRYWIGWRLIGRKGPL